MATKYNINEQSQWQLGLARKDNNQVIPGSEGPDVTFTSSDVGVMGVAISKRPNTLELLAVAPGSASLVISTPCTFSENGEILTQTKQKTIPVSVIENGGIFAVTLG
jgi:hypothetical protein